MLIHWLHFLYAHATPFSLLLLPLCLLCLSSPLGRLSVRLCDDLARGIPSLPEGAVGMGRA